MPRTLHRRNNSHGRMGTRGQPEESRAAILHAAAFEFAEHGIAGARTDTIAREARVNKALLYYYFKDKETLYGAVLDDAFAGLKSSVFQVLNSELPPREKILAYAGAYFDFIASNQVYPRLMQREMMRACARPLIWRDRQDRQALYSADFPSRQRSATTGNGRGVLSFGKSCTLCAISCGDDRLLLQQCADDAEDRWF